MNAAITFLAVCGVTYGAYALISLGNFTEQHREELKHKEAAMLQRIRQGGISGWLLGTMLPLVWLVTLPCKSIVAATAVAALLILPAMLTR
jgi:hypothetical protein